MSISGQEIHSVEQACTSPEAAELLYLMEDFVGASREMYVAGGRRSVSVHEIPGHTGREAAAIYEPRGRVECTEIPQAVEDILNGIFDRNLSSIQYVYPDAVRNNGWFYVEYGVGQFVNPHVDYHGRIGDPWPGVLATVSLSLRNADVGGQFFVESSGVSCVWGALPATGGWVVFVCCPPPHPAGRGAGLFPHITVATRLDKELPTDVGIAKR